MRLSLTQATKTVATTPTRLSRPRSLRTSICHLNRADQACRPAICHPATACPMCLSIPSSRRWLTPATSSSAVRNTPCLHNQACHSTPPTSRNDNTATNSICSHLRQPDTQNIIAFTRASHFLPNFDKHCVIIFEATVRRCSVALILLLFYSSFFILFF
jgi:hypothetical protein